MPTPACACHGVRLLYIAIPALGACGAADGDEIVVERSGVEVNEHHRQSTWKLRSMGNLT